VGGSRSSRPLVSLARSAPMLTLVMRRRRRLAPPATANPIRITTSYRAPLPQLLPSPHLVLLLRAWLAAQPRPTRGGTGCGGVAWRRHRHGWALLRCRAEAGPRHAVTTQEFCAAIAQEQQLDLARPPLCMGSTQPSRGGWTSQRRHMGSAPVDGAPSRLPRQRDWHRQDVTAARCRGSAPAGGSHGNAGARGRKELVLVGMEDGGEARRRWWQAASTPHGGQGAGADAPPPAKEKRKLFFL
jgi:hypothetical protein